ncbi:MAG: 3-deoxy-manno-octulosonate cytidylyltransferase [Deltaproteobacteria bacterium]
MPPSSVAVVIPARFGSTRLPGKPLEELAGKPMIQHVIERCRRARGVDEVLVATDDGRVAEAARAAGVRAVMTSADCQSGTDRVAEVAKGHAAGIFVNVQGDEPLLEPVAIEELIHCLHAGVPMATLCRPAQPGEDLSDPNSVKVAIDQKGDALYFSRSPIPFFRDGRPPNALSFVHVGIYGFQRDFLLQFAALAPGRLERAERLEQLRALEHGHKIRVVPTPYASVSVDTPEDLERVRRLLQASERVVH